MIEWNYIDTFVIKDRGLVYTGHLPFDIETAEDRHKVHGTKILLAGMDEMTIKAVELFMHAPPWRKGEPCGFMFEEEE